MPHRLNVCCPLFLAVALLAAVADESRGVTLGQVDDFQSLTTEGWIIGVGDENPMTVANGGPNGAGDAYLSYSAFGGSGPSSRLAFYNVSQWTGDYSAAGITALSADVNNLGGSEPLLLRLAIGSERNATGGTWFASTDAITLAPGSGWTSVVFPIDPASVTQAVGSGSYESLMSNVGALRIISSEVVETRGNAILATLGVDNLRAIPEPSSAMLVGIASLVAWRRRS